MNHNPVGWFEIYVQQMDRARAFYEAVLGVTLTRLEGLDHEMWAFPMNPTGTGASGALIHMPGAPSGFKGTMVYFSCQDCAIEAGRVEEAGGQIKEGKMSIGPYGFIAMAFDTEGNLFGLHSQN